MKIPIVKQRDLKDCGPCCIASILKYYNGFAPIEKIRNDCYTNINGTTAYHLKETLKEYGFDSYGEKVTINELKKINTYPLIAHLVLENGLTHYIVIYKINKKYLTIMDPQKGIKKITWNDFIKIFSGVVIICYPKSEEIIKCEKFNFIEFIIKILLQNKKIILKILISGVLSILFTIINGLYFKIGFSAIEDKKLLKFYGIFFLFIVISKILFEFLKNYYNNYLARDISLKLNKEFFQSFFSLPSKIVKDRTNGEVVTRVIELNNLHEIVTEIVITTIINLILAIQTFIILYFISLDLLKVLIIFTSVFIIICILSNKTIYKIIKENIESNEEFNSDVIEMQDAFESIKNNNLEKNMNDKMKKSILKYLNSNYIVSHKLNLITIPKNIIMDLMHFTLITTGLYLFINNKISMINFITFETYCTYLTNPVENILANIPKLNYLKASCTKIVEFMSLKKENLDNEECFLNGDISIKKLKYSYNNYNKVINNLNLEIKKNSNYLLKGNSGIGKSTLCKILNRSYDNYEGDICVNNINIKDYSLKTIRKNILYLSQNEFIFTDTIKNNIILNKKFDINKFNYICKICYVEDIVNKKALRYETTINNEFANISGGEKQRIILARALYQDFSILILDEALSEVNSDLEKNIINKLKSFLSNKTLIYISHKDLEEHFDDVIKVVS